jgi:hypothetical protein
MRRGNPDATRERLREDWGRWTTIVWLFTRRRPSRRRIDPRAYAALRDDLLAACRSLAEAETDGMKRSYYAGLEETVRPWLSPRVLARTDREILSALLHRCREVERELSGRRWTLEWPARLGPGARIIAAGVVILGLAWILMAFGVPVVSALRDVADTAWLSVKYADGFHKLSAVAVLFVAALMYTISRSVRLWS